MDGLEKETAIGIIECFEDLLDKYDIDIPSEYREGDESEARIFGENYYDLENKIICILQGYRKNILICIGKTIENKE